MGSVVDKSQHYGLQVTAAVCRHYRPCPVDGMITGKIAA